MGTARLQKQGQWEKEWFWNGYMGHTIPIGSSEAICELPIGVFDLFKSSLHLQGLEYCR